MDFSEKWGRDVEEAVKLALIDLKLERDQVEVIVLEEPSKGFLGFGSKLAKVRVQKIASRSAEHTEVRTEKGRQPEKSERWERPEKPDRWERPEKPDRWERPERPERNNKTEQKQPGKEDWKTEKKEESEAGFAAADQIQNTESKPGGSRRKGSGAGRNADRDYNRKGPSIRIRPDNLTPMEDAPALGFLKEVTQRMGLDLSIVAMENEECLYFDISGKDSGTIIGKRGQTLDSIQYLTSLVVNKESDKYNRVVVDAENYRQKREKTLEQLAIRLAEKVRKTGKSVRLEPMNPYERKVIHSTLQKNPSVTTRSEGEEPYRRVIIEQK